MLEYNHKGERIQKARISMATNHDLNPQMLLEQWKELKETIIELRDNDGISTQQEVCKFLVNLMNVLENQCR